MVGHYHALQRQLNVRSAQPVVPERQLRSVGTELQGRIAHPASTRPETIHTLYRLIPSLGVAALALSACASPNAASTPALDANAIFTAAQETFSAEQATRQGLATSTSTPQPAIAASPTPGATPQAAAGNLCDSAAYISDVTVPDGTALTAGASFVKTWLLQNNGTCAWTPGYTLAFVGGDLMGGANAPVPASVPAGAQSPLSVNLRAPDSPGTYTGQWRMRNAQGQAFGNVITVVITVGSPAECKRSSKTTVTISGRAKPENTTIDYGDGITYTDANGDYAITVPQGWSGTVIPSKAKVNPWSFFPAFRTYSNVNCDLRDENYKATPPPGV